MYAYRAPGFPSGSGKGVCYGVYISFSPSCNPSCPLTVLYNLPLDLF